MKVEQFRLHAEIEDEHWWFVGRRRIMQSLVERVLPGDPSLTVVDIGCGTGANIGALAGRHQAVGIDTSADAIGLARERFPAVRFIQGFAPHDLGATATEARMFLIMDVLEHVPDDFALFSELVAASSPGAMFLLTVPANPAMWSPQDEMHFHYRRYEPARLARLWEGLPLSPLLVSYFNSRLYRPIQAIRWINRWRGKTSGEADTDLFMPRPTTNRLLTDLFAGEARRLVNLVDAPANRGFSSGVSLIALLRREKGACVARTWPANVPPDEHRSAAPPVASSTI